MAKDISDRSSFSRPGLVSSYSRVEFGLKSSYTTFNVPTGFVGLTLIQANHIQTLKVIQVY